MIEAFPLYWPDGQPRSTSRRDNWLLKLSAERAQWHLRDELRKMGATEVIVSTGVPLRKRDGMMHAAVEPADPGVAVYFTHGKRQLVIACDSYTKLRWNLRACGLTVEALRSIQRNGATELLERAFTGFAALPPKGGTSRSWREVFDLGASATLDDAKSVYRRLAATHHPDKGGDREEWERINNAWAAAQKELQR